MKYTLIILLFILFGCGKKPLDYTYTFTVKITYLNGDTDTTSIDIDSYGGRKCGIYLSASSGNILSQGVTQPCIIKGCGLYREAVSCGVRKFNILKTEKVLLIK